MVNVLDDSYTKSSPCNKCPRHLKGLSKDSCLAKCKQLDAYRSGKPWEGLEWVEIAQQDPEKIKENKEVVAMEEEKIDEHRTSNIERPTSNEKNNQQSTINNQQSKVCVICHDKDKKILNKRSETCCDCYQQWTRGNIVHPTLGKFVPSQKHPPKPKISKKNPNQKSQKIKPRKKKKSLSLKDNVMQPPHYTQHPSGIECIDITKHMNFCCGNAVKYIWRAGLKNNAIEDLQKAVIYLGFEIGRLRGINRRQEAE